MRESRESKSQIGPFVRQPENGVLRSAPGANADPLACAPSERAVVQHPRIICQLLPVSNRDPDNRWPCKPDGAYVHVACDDSNGRLYGAKLKFSSPNAYQVYIPGCVREICSKYFWKLRYVDLVTFGAPSLLERIGVMAFDHAIIESLSIPDTVVEVCDECFSCCESLHSLTFGAFSSLERIGVKAFSSTSVEELLIPDSVSELSDRCFSGCTSLRSLTFGVFSSLRRIGVEAFSETSVEELSIPDGVGELSDRCFYCCKNLRSVTFGASPSVKRIGFGAFGNTIFGQLKS